MVKQEQTSVKLSYQSASEDRINNGRIIPVTALFVHICLFTMALSVTACLTAGLLTLFPWHDIIRTSMFLFVLPLFLFLNFWSMDSVRRSIQNVMWSENPNNYMSPVHVAGYVITAKNIHRFLNGSSVIFSGFAILWFHAAYTRSSPTPTIDTIMECVCSALTLYFLAVSIDVKRANTKHDLVAVAERVEAARGRSPSASIPLAPGESQGADPAEPVLSITMRIRGEVQGGVSPHE